MGNEETEEQAIEGIVSKCLEEWRQSGWKPSGLSDRTLTRAVRESDWAKAHPDPRPDDRGVATFEDKVTETLEAQMLPYRLGFLPQEAVAMSGWRYRIGMVVWHVPPHGTQGTGVVTHAYDFPWGSWVVVALTDEIISFVTDSSLELHSGGAFHWWSFVTDSSLELHSGGAFPWWSLVGEAAEDEEEGALDVYGLENRLLPLSRITPDLSSAATQGVMLELIAQGRQRVRRYVLEYLARVQRGYSMSSDIGNWVPATGDAAPISLGEALVLYAHERGGWLIGAPEAKGRSL